MQPFHQTDTATIYNEPTERLLLSLESETVDALITDPPYSSGGQFRSDKAQDPGVKYCQNGKTLGRISFGGDNRDQLSFEYWCVLWMQQCHRILKPSGYALLFTDWRQLPTVTNVFQAAGFIWRGIVPWDKGRGARAPHKGFFRHQCEYVVWGTKGKIPKATHDGPFEGLVRGPVKQADKFHMTGKPTPVMEELIRPVEPGGLILDPFAGSGPTALAAVRHDRRVIVNDAEPDNCQIIVDRLEAEARGEVLDARQPSAAAA